MKISDNFETKVVYTKWGHAFMDGYTRNGKIHCCQCGASATSETMLSPCPGSEMYKYFVISKGFNRDILREINKHKFKKWNKFLHPIVYLKWMSYKKNIAEMCMYNDIDYSNILTFDDFLKNHRLWKKENR